MALTPAQKTALEAVTTATLTTVLLKKGVRFCYIAGSNPIVQGDRRRIVGPAFTLRFTPTREDLATVDSWSSPRSTRAAIEDMPEGCVAVADAMGSKAAGIFGDILCARMAKKGVAGLVTDGVVRDGAGVIGTGLPVYCQGYVAPASV
ncbi:MAG: ribonuclease activity regulator RraA, partial [Alphaproteobacteria bacterium]|nr:ribonuclease activity regulator RraA [Alphaproteobacteria bacterium]